jgi:hypothetical protein
VATTTFARILAIAPSHPALPDSLKGRLLDSWGESPANEIGRKSVVELAEELAVILPVSDYDADTRFAAAMAIHDLLVRMGFANQAQQPQEIKVTFDKRPADMDIRELLDALAANPDQYFKYRPYIEATPEVMKATARSQGKWVITLPEGGIDVTRTMRYVMQLNRQHAAAQQMVDNRRPVTLARAMGIDERALIHPFTGRPVHGPDQNGFDLGQLPVDLHEALLWAAMTEHPAWPRVIDLYTYTEEVLSTPLPRRWQRMLDDYLHAKGEGEDSTRLVTRYWPEGLSLDSVINLVDQMLGGNTSGNQQGSNQSNAEQRVRAAASLTGTLRIEGSNNNYRGGVYETLTLRGSNNDLRNIVVTNGGRIKGSNNDGVLLLPPRVHVTIEGSNNGITQRNLSWDDLEGYL